MQMIINKTIGTRASLQRLLVTALKGDHKKLVRDSMILLAVLNEFSQKNVCKLNNKQLSTFSGIPIRRVWEAKKFLKQSGAISDQKVREGGMFNGEIITKIL